MDEARLAEIEARAAAATEEMRGDWVGANTLRYATDVPELLAAYREVLARAERAEADADRLAAHVALGPVHGAGGVLLDLHNEAVAQRMTVDRTNLDTEPLATSLWVKITQEEMNFIAKADRCESCRHSAAFHPDPDFCYECGDPDPACLVPGCPCDMFSTTTPEET